MHLAVNFPSLLSCPTCTIIPFSLRVYLTDRPTLLFTEPEQLELDGELKKAEPASPSMTDQRVRIHISKTSITIPAKDALIAREYSNPGPSSSFLPSPLHDHSLPHTSPVVAYRNIAGSAIRGSRSPSAPIDIPAERAATISRLSRFTYREPTPTRRLSSASDGVRGRSASPAVAKAIIVSPSAAPTGTATSRSRQESKGPIYPVVSITHDLKEETVASESLEQIEGKGPASPTSACLDMDHLDGVSDDEELDRLQAEAERSAENASPRIASPKRRKLSELRIA
jgi:hypothetical protein